MALFDPISEQLERRSPIGRWQIVQVTFTAQDVDVIVPHNLPTPDPEQVDYEVLRTNGPVVVYHDGSATRRSWGNGFIILRASVAPVVADLRLSVSTEPLQQRTIPRGASATPGLNADLLDGLDSTYFLNASNLATGVVALARGGTGASLADPNADRILFWDDSGGQVTWLTAGSGLQIVGTDLSVVGAGAGGTVAYTASTHTIADDGAGTAPSSTLTPSTSFVKITNNDPDGATLTISESGAVDGQYLILLNVGTNSVTLNDSAGVQEIAGTFVMGQWDAMILIYVTDRWVELSRSDN